MYLVLSQIQRYLKDILTFDGSIKGQGVESKVEYIHMLIK